MRLIKSDLSPPRQRRGNRLRPRCAVRRIEAFSALLPQLKWVVVLDEEVDPTALVRGAQLALINLRRRAHRTSCEM